MTTQRQQQTEQPSQVVLDELNEQDLAAVAGGIMLPEQTRRLLTPQDLQQLNRYPFGIGPGMYSTNGIGPEVLPRTDQ